MTAVHLINRLPSKVIGLRSPIELIEKQFPKVKLRNGHKLRVFGYVVFIHTHKMPFGKLFARAIRGIFVGFYTTQKGYCCYDPTSKRIFITKDIVFEENTFFLLTISPSTEDSYPSLPTQDESATKRIENSLPLQYPSLHLFEAPILDQMTPNHEGETSAPQPTSFTYFPKYYVRQKTMEPTIPSSTENNPPEPVNHHLSEHSRLENLPLALCKPSCTCVKPIHISSF